MTLELVALLAALAIAAIVAWPVLLSPLGKKTRFYKEDYKRVKIAPPGWLFPIVWFVMYGLIISSAIIHLMALRPISDATANPRLVALLSLWFINITLNHYWPVLFFRMRIALFAAIDSIFLMLSAGAVLVLYGYDGYWLSFGLYAPYFLWSIFATALSIMWVKNVAIPRVNENLARQQQQQSPAAVVPQYTSVSVEQTLSMRPQHFGGSQL